MRICLVLIILFLLTGCADYSGDPLEWVITIGGTGLDFPRDIAVDTYGNVYITGNFDDTVDFDPGPGIEERTAEMQTSVFLASYSPGGSLNWVTTWESDSFVITSSIEYSESSRSLFVAGNYYGYMDLDPDSEPWSADDQNGIPIHGYFAEFNTDGTLETFQALRATGDGGSIWYPQVAVDDSGNIFVAGRIGGSVDLDPGPGTDIRTGEHWSATFLAEYNPESNLQWAVTWDKVQVEELILNDSGNPVLTGTCSNTADFDPGREVAEAVGRQGLGAFLLSLDSDGRFDWVRTWGGRTRDVCSTADGGYFVTGYFQEDENDFDPGPEYDIHESSATAQAYTSRFDRSGMYLGAQTWASEDRSHATTIDYSYRDIVCAAGYFKGEIDLDPAQVGNFTGIEDVPGVYVIFYDADGNGFESRLFLGQPDEPHNISLYSDEIACDSSGNAYLVGSFTNEIFFDPPEGMQYTSSGDRDIFLCKFDLSHVYY